MSLRLSTTTTTSSSSNSLQTFEHDVNISAAAKMDVLKFLSVILRNLSDETKAADPKYRQLRLQNPKIAKMTAYPAVMSFLQHTLGFQNVAENGEALLKLTTAPTPDSIARMQSLRNQVNATQDRVSALIPRTVSNSSSSNSLDDETLMSEKQKARKLLEEKEAADKEAARLARKRTVNQIKKDKHVRENDPNWKPSVSAAAAKAGDAMSTFRDKFGE